MEEEKEEEEQGSGGQSLQFSRSEHTSTTLGSPPSFLAWANCAYPAELAPSVTSFKDIADWEAKNVQLNFRIFLLVIYDATVYRGIFESPLSCIHPPVFLFSAASHTHTHTSLTSRRGGEEKKRRERESSLEHEINEGKGAKPVE